VNHFRVFEFANLIQLSPEEEEKEHITKIDGKEKKKREIGQVKK
jgi:hypothetical protein